MRALTIALALLTMSGVAVPAFGKAPTSRIDVAGADLARPLRITDPDVLYRFSIWSGPGVQVDDPAVRLAGAFIDWREGAVEGRPKGLQHYDVSFFAGQNPEAEGAQPTYVVIYEYDPLLLRGYIYLPGREDAGYRRNVRSIYHGVEGNWFYASASWEQLVRPLIDKAKTQ